MKKYLIVLATALVALASCKPKEVELESIAFKQSELTMFVGDTTRIALLFTPLDYDVTKADLAITSSDTNVVKVLNDRIDITANASGTANIIAKIGEKQTVLKVTARTYEEAWGLTWLYYFPSTKSEKPLNDSIYDVNGYKCRLYSVEYFCPNPLDFDEDLTTGSGECLFAPVACLFIEDGSEYNGEMVARQFTVVNSIEDFTTKPFTTLAGKLDPAILGPVFQDIFEGYDEEEDRDIDWDEYNAGTNNGAHISYAKIADDGNISYSYLWTGIITNGWAARLYDKNTDKNYIDYDFGAQWCYGVQGTGLALNPAAKSWSEALAIPYALALSPVYNYKAGQEIAPQMSAPQKKAAKAVQSVMFNEKNWKTMEKPVKVARICDLQK